MEEKHLLDMLLDLEVENCEYKKKINILNEKLNLITQALQDVALKSQLQ